MLKLIGKKNERGCGDGHLDPNSSRPIYAIVAVQYIWHFMSIDVTVAKQSRLANVGCWLR